MAAGTSPSTELYTLGRGVLKIGTWSGDTPPTYPSGYSDAGNCIEFNLNVTEETLEHFSYRSGLRNKDKIVILETGYEGNFILDEISQVNLLKFLKGTLSGNTIRVNTVTDAEYALWFEAANPIGEKQRFLFHKVKLTPNGEMGLIGDEYMQLDFAYEGLSDETNNPDSPYFDVEWITTTT